MIAHAVNRTVGIVEEFDKKGDKLIVKLKLKIPICASPGDKIVVSSQIRGVWHLAGWGEILE